MPFSKSIFGSSSVDAKSICGILLIIASVVLNGWELGKAQGEDGATSNAVLLGHSALSASLFASFSLRSDGADQQAQAPFSSQAGEDWSRHKADDEDVEIDYRDLADEARAEALHMAASDDEDESKPLFARAEVEERHQRRRTPRGLV